MDQYKLRVLVRQLIATPIILGLTIAASNLIAAWTPPTAPPPQNDVIQPLHTGNVAQTKEAGLVLNSAGAAASHGLIVENGRVGIGNTAVAMNPQHMLVIDNGLAPGAPGDHSLVRVGNGKGSLYLIHSWPGIGANMYYDSLWKFTDDTAWGNALLFHAEIGRLYYYSAPPNPGGDPVVSPVVTLAPSGISVGYGQNAPVNPLDPSVWPQALDVNGAIRGIKFYDDDTNYYLDINSGGRLGGTITAGDFCAQGKCLSQCIVP